MKPDLSLILWPVWLRLLLVAGLLLLVWGLVGWALAAN